MSNGFRRALLDLDPGARAVCESPLLPFVCKACGACESDGELVDGADRHHAHHAVGHDHQHHFHLERGDVARFIEDPDDRPFVWDLEESSCH